MKKTKIIIDPSAIRTRDFALVAIINGSTKATPTLDRHKEQSRSRVTPDQE